MSVNSFVLLRGGGDLASGVALRLHRAGIGVVITELAQPLAVRRTVSFAEAVFEGTCEVEGVKARLIEADQLSAWNERGCNSESWLIPMRISYPQSFSVVVDARLTKQTPHATSSGRSASYRTGAWILRREQLPRCDRNPPQPHASDG